MDWITYKPWCYHHILRRCVQISVIICCADAPGSEHVPALQKSICAPHLDFGWCISPLMWCHRYFVLRTCSWCMQLYWWLHSINRLVLHKWVTLYAHVLTMFYSSFSNSILVGSVSFSFLMHYAMVQEKLFKFLRGILTPPPHPLYYAIPSLSFFFIIAVNCLKISNAWDFAFRKYVHVFLEKSSMKVMKYLEPESDGDGKGPQRSECIRSFLCGALEWLTLGAFVLFCFPSIQYIHNVSWVYRKCIPPHRPHFMQCFVLHVP